MWGVNRRRKGAGNTLAALKSIRAARPDGAPIYVILDNLSAHKGADINLVLGDAGAIQLYVNGTKIEDSWEPGTVEHVTYTKDDAQVG